MNDDRFHDECGVIGIYGHPEASKLAYLGLYALQHRGQESAGIAAYNGKRVELHRGMGLVNEVFDDQALAALPGSTAIGHVRYSTYGQSVAANVQPLAVDYARGYLAIAHNGSLVNAGRIREHLEREGSIFRTSTDTEVLAHLIASSRADGFLGRLLDALSRVHGAYSQTIITEQMLIGVRDPLGFRPLVLGRRSDRTWVLASETCALDLIEADFVREVEPGEIVIIHQGDLHSYFPFPKQRLRQCVFEYVYFARPDSFIFGHDVYDVRRRMGHQLALEQPAEADVVFCVPDSGATAALGYAEQLGMPLSNGLIRNHYVGRTFIEPAQSIRHFGVKVKLNPIRAVIKGRRCVVIDDSIVRGTTMRKIVRMIRAAGATEVHLRISSPPTVGQCHYGIDTPTREELIAARLDLEGIREFIGADSLGYLSIEGMLAAIGDNQDDFCCACFNHDYPIEPEKEGSRRQMTLFD
ncbi:MAG: amidophosphoribosyltransferase [Candidatus Alcyoniella australis]|nr:amidophosphoribosyltransferase [Candidatus Alcyoniella australis]